MGIYAGYVRVSHIGDRAETLISPELQQRAIEKWAKDAGHDLIMLEREMDESGADDTRPILLGAIEQIERGQIDGIAVWRLDRFTRSLASSVRFLEQIEKAGGKVESATERFAEDSGGRLHRNITLSIAQGERERQAEGFERSKADAIRRGVYTAPVVPVGYLKNKDRKLEPDPATAPYVVEAFEMRAAGSSWNEIAAMLSERLGRPMYGPTVSRMIANRAYLGEARQGEHVNPSAWEPIIDADLFQTAQQNHPRPPRGRHGRPLLGGIVRCAGCSWRMTSTMRRGKREYRCRRHGAMGTCPEPTGIAAKILEPVVERAFLEHVANLPVDATARSRSIDTAEGALREAEAARDDFATATAGMAREHIAAGMEARAEAVEAARRNLAEARLASPPLPEPAVLLDIWQELDVEERNHVLGRALGVVWVRRGERGDTDRIRIVDPTGVPDGLSVQGRPSPPHSFDRIDADLPGEIRLAAA